MTTYEVVLGKEFKRAIKKLRKRFPSIQADVKKALKDLVENPELGILLGGLEGVRKYRVRSTDLARGKSGGFRLIYRVNEERRLFMLIVLYAKSDRETISSKKILEILKKSEGEDWNM